MDALLILRQKDIKSVKYGTPPPRSLRIQYLPQEQPSVPLIIQECYQQYISTHFLNLFFIIIY